MFLKRAQFPTTERLESSAKKQAMNTASANVMNLQRRVAGVLRSRLTCREQALHSSLPEHWCSMKKRR